MAEDEGFLKRWSNRKRGSAAPAKVEPSSTEVADRAAAPPAQPTDVEPPDRLEPPDADEPLDLPLLESIGVGGDIKAFLQQGVPPALRRAALRRLWSTDPRIRDFREVADYDWDFNAPGYGALRPGDDPRALAERLLARVRRQAEGGPTADPTVQDGGLDHPGRQESGRLPSGRSPTDNATYAMAGGDGGRARLIDEAEGAGSVDRAAPVEAEARIEVEPDGSTDGQQQARPDAPMGDRGVAGTARRRRHGGAMPR